MGSENEGAFNAPGEEVAVPKILVTELRAMRWELSEVIRRLEVLRSEVDQALTRISASEDDEEVPGAL